MEESIVVVKDLTKIFHNRTVVDHLSFTVNKGEIVGLLGANGAGKTTTIHMLLGLTKQSSGQIEMFNKDLQRHRIESLRRMNFASAYQALPHNLKVWENLYIFAEIYGVKQSKQRVEELLELFEIVDLRNTLTGGLSSGEQTRVNLCKALLNNPELLLLDEPTASLDPYMANKVRTILAQLQKETNMTIINTSHNMIDVHKLCHRILFMQKGKIIAQGSADEIMNKFGSQSLDEVYITLAQSNTINS